MAKNSFIITWHDDNDLEIHWNGYEGDESITEHYEIDNPYGIAESLEEFIHYYVELKD